MKKFKKSIEINYENIKDVLRVPIVEGIHKVNNDYYVEGRGKPYFTSAVAVLPVPKSELVKSMNSAFGYACLARFIISSLFSFFKKGSSLEKI